MDLSKEQKSTVIGIVFVLMLGSMVFFYRNYLCPSQIEIEDPNNSVLINEQTNPAALLVIHIEGAVKCPGVYKLKYGDRIIDAIEAAGGSRPNARLSALNLAEKVKDGQKVVVPEKVKTAFLKEGGGVGSGGSIVTRSGGLISINQASQKELEKLSGIGPSTAKKIIDYRSQNGPFSKLEDLMKVNRIGKKSFEKIKDRIRL